MPGIVAATTCGSREIASKRVDRMLARMLHQPEYRATSFVDDRSSIGLGAVVVEGSFPLIQTYFHRCAKFCLAFTGESFGRHQFATGEGEVAEALLALYEAAGTRFVQELNGVFSGALLDRGKNELHVFNDRYGLSRVFYHESAGNLLLASEAKALLGVLPSARNLDHVGLGEFLSIGSVLQDRSLFPGISTLPPASIWTVRFDGTIKKGRYFNPEEWEEQEPLSERDYEHHLVKLLENITPRYVAQKGLTAMSVTGGIDSRMVLAGLRPPAGTLPCYTFGGPYRDSADVRIGRRVAGICGQSHSTIRITSRFFDQFQSLAAKSVLVSDGAMDVSGAVELHVNEIAREVAPVRLTGNYGSEILRSHVAFRPGKVDSSVFAPEVSASTEEAARTYAREAEGNLLSFIAFKQVPWHHHARYTVERSTLLPRSPFLDNALVQLAYRAPAALRRSTEPSLNVIAQLSPTLLTVPTDRALGSRTVLRSKIAHRWQEFTAKAEYAYDYGMPRKLALADYVVSPLRLERLFLGRHKFYHFRVWYRDRLAATVREILLDAASLARPYLRRHAVERLVAEHLRGTANHTLSLHKLLTLELIHRELLQA